MKQLIIITILLVTFLLVRNYLKYRNTAIFRSTRKITQTPAISPDISFQKNNTGGKQSSDRSREIIMGDPVAPITIVEFADFQCSYCRIFWENTLPNIKKNYIDKGKVKFIYKNNVVLGNLSTNAANAALCANEQNRFWKYHDLLYQNQPNGGPAFFDDKLASYASVLNLDSSKFAQCLTEERYNFQIESETKEAQDNTFTNTPSFFVNGIAIIGAEPYSIFKTIIDEQLKKN